MDKKLVNRLISKVNFSSLEKCWEWQGAKNFKGGYGIIGVDEGNRLAHRLMYELFFEPIPRNVMACHHCDNPACCNPTHIFLGDHKSNARDMMNKGRHPCNGRPVGEDAFNSRLKNEEVLEMRRLRRSGKTVTSLSEQFKVSRGNVTAICTYRTWKNLP